MKRFGFFPINTTGRPAGSRLVALSKWNITRLCDGPALA